MRAQCGAQHLHTRTPHRFALSNLQVLDLIAQLRYRAVLRLEILELERIHLVQRLELRILNSALCVQ